MPQPPRRYSKADCRHSTLRTNRAVCARLPGPRPVSRPIERPLTPTPLVSPDADRTQMPAKHLYATRTEFGSCMVADTCS